MKQNRIKITYGLLVLYSIVLVHLIIFHQYDSEFLSAFFPNKEKAQSENRSSLEVLPYGAHFNILSDSFEFSKNKFGVSKSNFEFSKNKKVPSLMEFFLPLLFVIPLSHAGYKRVVFRPTDYSFFDSLYSKTLQLRAPPPLIQYTNNGVMRTK